MVWVFPVPELPTNKACFCWIVLKWIIFFRNTLFTTHPSWYGLFDLLRKDSIIFLSNSFCIKNFAWCVDLFFFNFESFLSQTYNQIQPTPKRPIAQLKDQTYHCCKELANCDNCRSLKCTAVRNKAMTKAAMRLMIKKKTSENQRCFKYFFINYSALVNYFKIIVVVHFEVVFVFVLALLFFTLFYV